MEYADVIGSYGILAVTTIASVLGLAVLPRIIERNLLRPFEVVNQHVYSPIITCGFVHGDFGHLLFNMLTLYFFGPGLERTIGTPHFVALYFIALIVSSVGTVIRRRRDRNYASLGASGAIVGVLFAYICYYPTRMLYVFFSLPVPALLYAVLYLGYTWWAARNMRDGINHDAHFDGALTGLLFVVLTDIDAIGHAMQDIAS
jgi:membrane associated rhomboid family serine protease